MRPGLPGFAADAGKTARIGMRPSDCRKVTTLPGEAERAVQQASRLIDFPERPQDHSQPAAWQQLCHRRRTGGQDGDPARGHRPRGPVQGASARRRNRPGTSKLRQRCAVPGPTWNPGECWASRRKATATSRIGARSARTKLTIHMP